MFERILRVLFTLFQRALVYFFYLIPCKGKGSAGIVIGTEVASLLHNLSCVLEHDSVNLAKNKFYRYSYNYTPYMYSRFLSTIYRCYILSTILRKYHIVTYIGSDGLLISQDAREWEFELLKKSGIKIVCAFLGTDIRSFKLMNDKFQPNGTDTISTYHHYVLSIDYEERESRLRKISEVSDSFADMIFNCPVDQMSYLKSEQVYFPYIIEDYNFHNNKKWESTSTLVVLHCPSSPIIKGTQLVRSAIRNLTEKGYDFEYVELIGVSHDVVLKELARAHIVLNQFYAFVPGVFGLEAMASNSVLLTSADRSIETILPEGANEAWVVTPYWKVQDNLQAALDCSVEELKLQAEKGKSWAIKHGSYENAMKYLNDKYQSI